MAGYNRYSKSNNAVEAEENGRMTASSWAKELKVSAKAIKEVLGESGEWHHTSNYYNETSYYDEYQIEENKEEILAKEKELKAVKKDVKIHKNCLVEWGEWEGSRRYPVLKKHKEEGCTVTVKGDWATVEFVNKKTMRKRIDGKHFKFCVRRETK